MGYGSLLCAWHHDSGDAVMIPYVSDEAFEALDQADGWTQQEWNEWKTEQELKDEQAQYRPAH